MNKQKNSEKRFICSLVTVLSTTVLVLLAVAVFHVGPQIPLAAGCIIAGVSALLQGYSLKEILKEAVKGVADSLKAIVILLLIGMLSAVLIASGTVPSLMCYGMVVITPKTVLVTAALGTALVGMILGSWGAVGTIGIAFFGIGISYGISAGMIAGSIISGAYFGEIVSPVADVPNLVTSLFHGRTIPAIRKVFLLALAALAVSEFFYLIMGFGNASGTAAGVTENWDEVLRSLESSFDIGPLTLVPLFLVLGLVLFKIPAAAALSAGIAEGALQAVLFQGSTFSEVMRSLYDGFVYSGNNESLRTLLSAGGVKEIIGAVVMIIVAMGFGGLIKGTGQMDALTRPLLEKLNRPVRLRIMTVLSCIGVNGILPDQYLGLSVSGQIYGDEYERQEISRDDLCADLLCGGGATSPMLPWNTCAMYCSSVLDVQALHYIPYAFFGMLIPLFACIRIILKYREK